MNNKLIFSQIFTCFAYILAQVMLLRNVSLFNFAFCYIYIAFILLLPLNIGRIALLLISFFIGIVVDIFYDTLGIHAAATTFLGFIRYMVVKLMKGGEDMEMNVTPNVREMGIQWFFVYGFILAFAHHLVLLLIEASNFALFFRVVFRAFTSAIFTLIVMIAIQYILYPTKKRSIFG